MSLTAWTLSFCMAAAVLGAAAGAAYTWLKGGNFVRVTIAGVLLAFFAALVGVVLFMIGEPGVPKVGEASPVSLALVGTGFQLLVHVAPAMFAAAVTFGIAGRLVEIVTGRSGRDAPRRREWM
jgi:hypothetical protein